MKILHVYKTFINDTMGGTEQVIAQLGSTHHQADFTHTVLSLTHQPTGVLEDGVRGIKNIRYKEQLMIASNSMSLAMLRDFRDIVQGFDLIHYHFPWPFADLMHLLWGIKKPTLLTYHSDVVRQKLLLRLYHPMMYRFLDAVDTIVATSPQYLATSPVLQRYRNKTVVVPIGIDREAYPTPRPERLAYWRERFNGRFFLFVGMMRYYKGLPILLASMVGTDYPLVIVGQGPCETALKEQAQRLNLRTVHFLGNVSEEDKIALVQLCFAFVFPSILRSEAFGVSLLEAAMFGKPMISTALGTGTSYINQHDETGLVVQPADVAELRAALTYLWTHPQQAEAMGVAAQARYQKMFTGQQMIAGYEKLYQSRMAQCPTEPRL